MPSYPRRLAVCLTTLSVGFAVASKLKACPNEIPLHIETHVLGEKETLSSVLFAKGIGNPTPRLYGRRGWLELTRRINNGGPKWLEDLDPGASIRLPLPWPANEPKPTDEPGSTPWIGLHKLRSGDTVSEILHDCGVGEQELFGDKGWIKRTLTLNKGWLDDAEDLPEGEWLILEHPLPQTSEAALAKHQTDFLSKAKELEQKNPDSSLRSESQAPPAPIPPEKAQQLAEELTEDKIANMSPSEAAAVPKEVQEEKAHEASFFDSFKPGMDKLFEGLQATGASAYVGARYGLSLVDRTSPLSKLKLFGLLTEVRGGPLSGLRFYWDYVPEVSGLDSTSTHLEFNLRRYLFGWAFEMSDLPAGFRLHLVPKIGRYTLSAKMEDTKPDDTGVLHGQSFAINGATSAGVEVDVEQAAYFYILRGWAARDLPLNKYVAFGKDASVGSERFGIDLFLKGGGFSMLGAPVSLSYLLFFVDERLQLESPAKGFSLQMELPFAGAGLSLAW